MIALGIVALLAVCTLALAVGSLFRHRGEAEEAWWDAQPRGNVDDPPSWGT